MARKKNSIGCLFYIALVLLVLVIFLFNRSTVQNVLDKTGFLKLFQKEKENPVEVVVTPLDPLPEAGDEHSSVKDGGQIVVAVENENPVEKTPEEGPPKPKVRKARIFFITVTDEGEINLKGVIRAVQYQDAPLRATLDALLAGPLPAEVNRGLITLISPETQLRNIYIKNGTAYLDFDESFRFNSLGKEGLIAQLKQIVYSTTEFANIDRVQFLIEGKTSEFLGPEGIAIGKPLLRSSFRQ